MGSSPTGQPLLWWGADGSVQLRQTFGSHLTWYRGQRSSPQVHSWNHGDFSRADSHALTELPQREAKLVGIRADVVSVGLRTANLQRLQLCVPDRPKGDLPEHAPRPDLMVEPAATGGGVVDWLGVPGMPPRPSCEHLRNSKVHEIRHRVAADPQSCGQAGVLRNGPTNMFDLPSTKPS